MRTDYGATVNSLRTFNSNALLVKGADPIPFSVDFAPVGPVGEQSFTVGAGRRLGQRARDHRRQHAGAGADRSGRRAVRLGDRAAGARRHRHHRRAGQAGRVARDRARHRFGVRHRCRSGRRHQRLRRAGHGRPAPSSFLNSGGYTGLNDVANHPARQAIEFAVANRLVDGYSDKQFRPDQYLKRSELAQYLVMGDERAPAPAVQPHAELHRPGDDRRRPIRSPKPRSRAVVPCATWASSRIR